MKLIIDIPDNEYKYTCERTLSDRTMWDDAIRNGIPLDDVKAEIETALAKEGNTDTAKAQAIALSWVLELLDRIGRK